MATYSWSRKKRFSSFSAALIESSFAMETAKIIVFLCSCLSFELALAAGMDGQAACAWGSSNEVSFQFITHFLH